jgi:YVTN family beta-propeller protein
MTIAARPQPSKNQQNLTGRKIALMALRLEVVMLPKKGDGAFPDEKDSDDRSREPSGIAYIPTTSLALVTDENDDVVRVVDVVQKKMIRVIALPSNSEPVMVALNATGTLAAVAERGRSKIALIDLVTWRVVSEITVGAGPLSLAISGNLAVVVNGNANSVTLVNLTTGVVVATVPVGAGPRSVAIDSANIAYTTNQADGTISVLNLATAKVTGTIALSGARPAAIRLLAGTPYAIVTDPATADDGKVLVVNLATGVVTSFYDS